MPLIKLERCTLQERVEIIKIYYKNGENLAETVRKTRTFMGLREAPCRTAIKKLVEKVELLGQVSDVRNEIRGRRSRTAENIAAVAESFEKNHFSSNIKITPLIGKSSISNEVMKTEEILHFNPKV